MNMDDGKEMSVWCESPQFNHLTSAHLLKFLRYRWSTWRERGGGKEVNEKGQDDDESRRKLKRRQHRRDREQRK